MRATIFATLVRRATPATKKKESSACEKIIFKFRVDLWGSEILTKFEKIQ
jgi:hypothetical protein